MDKWLTVVAQIVNFLILVWLLKRFLYGRIIKAMDDRQAKIASQLDEAARKKMEAEEEAADFRQKSDDIDAKREEMLAKAKEDADAHRAELVKDARAEVDALETRWRESVERQQAAFLQDLRQRATKQTFAIARRVLSDLAGADLEARIVAVFVGKLESLPDEDWQALATPIHETDDEGPELVVRSVFDLPDEQRRRIEEVVRGRVGDGVGLRFEMAFDPICGIELRGQGRKVAWTIEHYLGSLEEGLAEALEHLPSARKLQGERERDVERDEEEKSADGSLPAEASAEAGRQEGGEEEGEEEQEHEHEREHEEEKEKRREEIEDEGDDEDEDEGKNG